MIARLSRSAPRLLAATTLFGFTLATHVEAQQRSWRPTRTCRSTCRRSSTCARQGGCVYRRPQAPQPQPSTRRPPPREYYAAMQVQQMRMLEALMRRLQDLEQRLAQAQERARNRPAPTPAPTPAQPQADAYADVPPAIQPTTSSGAPAGALASNPFGIPTPSSPSGSATTPAPNAPAPAVIGTPAGPAAPLALDDRDGSAGNPGYLRNLVVHLKQIAATEDAKARPDAEQLQYRTAALRVLEEGCARVEAYVQANRWATSSEVTAFQRQRGDRIRQDIARQEKLVAELGRVPRTGQSQDVAMRNANLLRQEQRILEGYRNELARLPLAGPAGDRGEHLVALAGVPVLQGRAVRDAIGHLSFIRSSALAANRPVHPSIVVSHDCLRRAITRLRAVYRKRGTEAKAAGVLDKLRASLANQAS